MVRSWASRNDFISVENHKKKISNKICIGKTNYFSVLDSTYGITHTLIDLGEYFGTQE